jgi:hypothetical protein
VAAPVTETAAAPAAAEQGIRAWFDRLVEFRLPEFDLAHLELPVLEMPKLDLPRVQLPSPDEMRMSVVRALDTVQDAVMTAPAKAQEIVEDVRESVTKSVVLLREAVGI